MFSSTLINLIKFNNNEMTRRLLRILSPFLLLLCSAPLGAQVRLNLYAGPFTFNVSSSGVGALESAAAAFTLTTAYTVRDHLGSTRAVVGREQLKQA